MQPEVVVAVVVTIIIAVVIVYLVLRPKTETLVPDRAELLAIENEWRAPAELASTGVPRAVRFERGTKVFFVCAALLLFGAGVYVLREALHGVREFERVERAGVEGQAVVIRKWITRGKSGTRYAAYLFKVGGAAYQRRAELSRKAYGRVQPGDRVAVRYLPSDPSVSRLLVEERPALPDSLWGLGVFLFALAFALGLYVWNVLLLRRLLQWGLPVAAFVTHRSYVSGRGSHYYVRYRFLDTSGNPVDGHERLVYDAPRLRATVTVLYDPQKPSRNALYPFSFSGFEGISKGTPSPSEPVPEQPLAEHPAIPRVSGFRLDNVDQYTDTYTPVLRYPVPTVNPVLSEIIGVVSSEPNCLIQCSTSSRCP